MKPVARVLVILAFLFSGQLLSGKTAQPSHNDLRPASQNSAPGSVVRFERLTIQDGLSQNAGLAIFQDSRGFLWVGTQDGLNRYDDYSFTVFKNDAENSASISHNSILSIAEDKSGFLWVGTWGGGLNRFDPVTETFTAYRNIPHDLASLSNDTVTSILQDSDGEIWVGTLGVLDRFNPDINGFDHFRNIYDDPASLSSNVISVIFEDSRRQLWIGTRSNGLNRMDFSSPSYFTRYRHDHQFAFAPIHKITDFIPADGWYKAFSAKIFRHPWNPASSP